MLFRSNLKIFSYLPKQIFLFFKKDIYAATCIILLIFFELILLPHKKIYFLKIQSDILFKHSFSTRILCYFFLFEFFEILSVFFELELERKWKLYNWDKYTKLLLSQTGLLKLKIKGMESADQKVIFELQKVCRKTFSSFRALLKSLSFVTDIYLLFSTIYNETGLLYLSMGNCLSLLALLSLFYLYYFSNIFEIIALYSSSKSALYSIRSSLLNYQRFEKEIFAVDGVDFELNSFNEKINNSDKITQECIEKLGLKKVQHKFFLKIGEFYKFFSYFVFTYFLILTEKQHLSFVDLYLQVLGTGLLFLKDFPKVFELESACLVLSELENIIDTANISKIKRELKIGKEKKIEVSNMTINTDISKIQTNLLSNVNYSFSKSTLIMGESGSGKSLFFKSIAGIYPHATGNVLSSTDNIIFTPQIPYLPFSKLINALAYPLKDISEERMVYFLKAYHLEKYIPLLQEKRDWNSYVSLADQNKISLLKIDLLKPDIVFFDEVTSHLSETEEAQLFSKLCNSLNKSLIISIGHKESLKKFHEKCIHLEATTFVEKKENKKIN